MNSVDNCSLIFLILLTLTGGSACFAGESISEDQMTKMKEMVRSSFTHGSTIQAVSSECRNPDKFELGMPVLEVNLQDIKFASDRNTPARIGPYLTTQGIYAVPVIVDEKACYIEQFRFSVESVEHYGSIFSPTYAEKLVIVSKMSIEKKSLVERVVCLNSDMVRKIVVIYKDGTEEFHSYSPKMDQTPDSAAELRVFLRRVYINQGLIPTK